MTTSSSTNSSKTINLKLTLTTGETYTLTAESLEEAWLAFLKQRQPKPLMSFSMALESLKQGYKVKRRSWSTHHFIFKANFSQLECDISQQTCIPDFGQELVQRLDNHLSLYIPTGIDLFASDWELVL